MFSPAQLGNRFRALTIFRSMRTDPVICAFMDVILAQGMDAADRIEAYAHFVHQLFQTTENFTDYVWRRVALDENIYVHKLSGRHAVSDMLRRTVEYELQTLQAIALIDSQEVKKSIACDVFLPDWITDPHADFCRMYAHQADNLFTTGYGIYASHTVFTFTRGKITPVKHPDSITLSSLTGYERPRRQVIDNTLAFIQGKPAANVLLYGDAGTGKSSTVKAVVNEFAPLGLRMIEIRKAELLEIPNLLEQLTNNPLKFILFIDDLSFTRHNEQIGALKALLEGSVSAKSSNVVIYTTSNRRHLVNETFEDRQGSDVHVNETIQEQTSLSDRFGLSILFAKPDKSEYLHIVHGLLREYGIEASENTDLLAERHALERGGRSARTARQFVEKLKSSL